MTQKILSISLLLIFLTGCAAKGTLWVSTVDVDEFTDETTKMVTVGEGLSDQFIITQTRHLYPFVGLHEDELFVGIRSGGKYKIPTGTVQMRIDNNPTWTITTSETPVYLVPPSNINTAAVESMVKAQGVESKYNVEAIHKQAMDMAARIGSPFTAATGEKAKKILQQMITGKQIKTRVIGLNQAASTIGETKIDGSFIEALKEIGIDPNSL